MQTLEAVISLLFLIMVTMTFLSTHDNAKIDSSLYGQQLLNDVWRVLYLRGDFKDFSFASTSIAREEAEKDLGEIGRLSSLCVFISGERLTNCRGEQVKDVLSAERSLFVDGKITIC